ncbi:MAG: RNA methyltransferase, partial [Desulfobacteraceae bacterium]|nr:RNA methyltransferase [Desulfobacteraceae bacterium]
TAMGAQKWVKALKTCDLAQTLMEKKENGHTIIGCETVEGSTAYDSYLWPPKGVVVFGNEEYGISSHVLSVCDDAVRIPMRGKKNSINVASAVSVIAFHIASCLLK